MFFSRGYLCLLTCILFHSQDQLENERVDQYLAALIRLDQACAYEDSITCLRCYEPAVAGDVIRGTHLCGRLVSGLFDEDINRVLAKDYNEELYFKKVVLACKSPESSKVTQSASG